MASNPLRVPGQTLDKPLAPARQGELRVIVRDWRELDHPAGIARWDALAFLAKEPNPFLESWYLLPALREFAQEREVQLFCLESDGQLLGLLPIKRSRSYYRYPVPNLQTWHHHNSFLGVPLVAPGAERVFWQALLFWADDHAGSTLFLHCTHLPLDGVLHEALCDVLRADRRHATIVHREERALLASELSPDAYLEAAMTGKKRKELRRQYNRLSEQGALHFERQRDDADLVEWSRAFLALERSGWKGAAGSALASSQSTSALFCDAMKGAATRGRLERLTLSLDGNPIAMLANFITPPGAFSYKTAFDESYSRFSPGVLLQRENLALLDDETVLWCDSCAAADHPMIDHIWRERRTIGRYSIAIGGTLRRTAFRAISWAENRNQPSPAGTDE